MNALEEINCMVKAAYGSPVTTSDLGRHENGQAKTNWTRDSSGNVLVNGKIPESTLMQRRWSDPEWIAGAKARMAEQRKMYAPNAAPMRPGSKGTAVAKKPTAAPRTPAPTPRVSAASPAGKSWFRSEMERRFGRGGATTSKRIPLKYQRAGSLTGGVGIGGVHF